MTQITPLVQYGRDTSGNAVLHIQTEKRVTFSNVGTVTGNADLRFGATGKENYTQITYQHYGVSDNAILLSNTFNNNYNIVGENANVYSTSGLATRTIQVDAVNSNIDLSNANGSQFVYMSDVSQNNRTQLGSGNDYLVDAGKFNHTSDIGGSNRYDTTETNFGSVILGGGGDDQFMIGGKYSIIDGGAGNDIFKGIGMFGEDATASYRNIILGSDGNDTFVDKGGYNIFFGGNGNNSAEVSGIGSIVHLGTNSNQAGGTYGSSAVKNYIFTTDELTTESGTTYNIHNIMKKFNWSLYDFLFGEDSQISEENKATIGKSGIVDDKTLAKLEDYFQETINQ